MKNTTRKPRSVSRLQAANCAFAIQVIEEQQAVIAAQEALLDEAAELLENLQPSPMTLVLE